MQILLKPTSSTNTQLLNRIVINGIRFFLKFFITYRLSFGDGIDFYNNYKFNCSKNIKKKKKRVVVVG